MKLSQRTWKLSVFAIVLVVLAVIIFPAVFVTKNKKDEAARSQSELALFEAADEPQSASDDPCVSGKGKGSKSSKAPSVKSAKSTKAPSVKSAKSTKAPSVKSAKSAKSAKSTKAPTVDCSEPPTPCPTSPSTKSAKSAKSSKAPSVKSAKSAKSSKAPSVKSAKSGKGGDDCSEPPSTPPRSEDTPAPTIATVQTPYPTPAPTLTTEETPPPSPVPTPCPQDELILYEVKQNWTWHLENAIKVGCIFGSINSVEEQLYAQRLMQDVFGPSGQDFTWFGAIRVDGEKPPYGQAPPGGFNATWSWVDGSGTFGSGPSETFYGYQNWTVNRPSNPSPLFGGWGDYAGMNTGAVSPSSEAYGWGDMGPAMKWYAFYKCCPTRIPAKPVS